MSDFLRVICQCGCENRVPIERRGGIVSCAVCGNEVAVAADAPIDPDEQPSSPASGTAAPRARSGARSPFEDRDPGEADFSKRFRRHEAALYDPSIDERCSRCGRELRGEWDRLQAASGVLCYICANQGAEGTPERLKRAAAAQEDAHRSRPSTVQPETVGVAYSPWRKHRSLAAKVAVVGLLVSFFAAVYVLTTFDIHIPILGDRWVSARSPDAADINTLATPAWVLYQAWTLFMNVTPVFIAAFASLAFTSAVSGQQLLKNVYGAVALAAPIAVITFIGIVVLPVFGKDAARATFIAVILLCSQALALVYAAFELLEESAWHCAYFVLIFVAVRLALPYLNAPLLEFLRAM